LSALELTKHLKNVKIQLW